MEAMGRFTVLFSTSARHRLILKPGQENINMADPVVVAVWVEVTPLNDHSRGFGGGGRTSPWWSLVMCTGVVTYDGCPQRMNASHNNKHISSDRAVSRNSLACHVFRNVLFISFIFIEY